MKLYRIHFGSSKKSKKYKQAVELSNIAYKHEEIGDGEDLLHIVYFTDKQIDLMASIYNLSRNLTPKIYGANIISLILDLNGKVYSNFYSRTKLVGSIK